MITIPTVLEQTPEGVRAYDLYSRLLKDRIIMLCDEVNDHTAQIIIGQLLFLEAEDPEKPIYLYINSPGGSVSAGLAIYDTMNYIQCDVSTICFGIAASMAAVILSAGTPGMRYALPNAEIMIHQPLGGAQGQASDIQIQAEHMAKTKEKLTKILAEKTKKDYDTIYKDTDRDNWFDAESAKKYGLIDDIK